MTFTIIPKEAIRFKDGDCSINYLYNDEIYEYNPETNLYELSLNHFISDNEEEKMECYRRWVETIKVYLHNFPNEFTENKYEDEENAFQLRWYPHATFYDHPVFTLMNNFYQHNGEKYVQIPIINGTISLLNDEGKITLIDLNEEFQTNEWGDLNLNDHIEFPCKKIDLFLIFQANHEDVPYNKFGDEFYPTDCDAFTYKIIDKYGVLRIYTYLGYHFDQKKLYIQLYDEDDHEKRDCYIYQIQHDEWGEVKVEIDYKGTYMKLQLDDDTEIEVNTQKFFDVYQQPIAKLEIAYEYYSSSDEDEDSGCPFFDDEFDDEYY
jgi:hypothetical protein